MRRPETFSMILMFLLKSSIDFASYGIKTTVWFWNETDKSVRTYSCLKQLSVSNTLNYHNKFLNNTDVDLTLTSVGQGNGFTNPV